MQALLGHADVSTTMIYTNVLKVGAGAVRSPLDSLVHSRGDQVAREAGVGQGVPAA